MKKTRKKLISALLCALILTPTLASCSAASEGESYESNQPVANQVTDTTNKPSSGSSSQNTGTNESKNNIAIDTYKEQISYYMSLTESLQQELLELKEDSYIDACEYQLKITELEDTIEMLKKTIANLSGETSSTEGTQSPSNDQLASKLDFKFTENNGKITITGYTGSSLDITVPQSINGMPVVAIGDEAFKGAAVRSITLPSSVTEIGWFAFSSCTVLESITIPSSITSVGYGAFDYCPKTMKIVCEKGSYAETYAISWGLNSLTK